MAAAAILDFQKFKILTVDPVPGAITLCVILLNFIKIGRTVADKWWFNVFFQNGGRPLSWICWAPTGATHDEHSVVSVVSPNLVKIDAVVSITWSIQYFARLAWKRLFTPQKLGFRGIYPQNGQQYQRHPKSAGRNGSTSKLDHTRIIKYHIRLKYVRTYGSKNIIRRPMIPWRRNYGYRGVGLHCTPKFRACTPCTPKSKMRLRDVKILSKRL